MFYFLSVFPSLHNPDLFEAERIFSLINFHWVFPLQVLSWVSLQHYTRMPRTASKEFSDDIAIVELQKVLKDPKTTGDGKYLEVSVGCINSSSYVFSQFGYKPFISFILLPLYFSDNQPLKLGCWSSTCLQPHAPLMICMLILELSAHLIVCKFSSLKAGSIYFLGLWVR